MPDLVELPFHARDQRSVDALCPVSGLLREKGGAITCRHLD